MAKQITSAEFQVMDILWEQAPMAAADIADRLAAETGWSLKTVKTLLSRLVDKGAITHKPDGRRYLYRPKVSRAAYEKRETRKLADQLFGGRAAPLVAHLADGDGLSKDDMRALEDLIKELKRDAD
ncbi:BlaI/MecI/CopY family transcriptional regulator [Hyphococcus flavus]|uniref:BlaI/MecI/CopY family transcriptional regulator n=1 Tax=Hyphococcus flavus TaxID=1866326 RepID=A0AAE9ZII4_9PROT|nr:BlaI/MecI/CopY family transcriptional regulator [Hyphococcus flavus]WDI30945.1 BlaI/MecI/CopY family transcriptional regulator [Hyphococcus flavus]